LITRQVNKRRYLVILLSTAGADTFPESNKQCQITWGQERHCNGNVIKTRCWQKGMKTCQSGNYKPMIFLLITTENKSLSLLIMKLHMQKELLEKLMHTA